MERDLERLNDVLKLSPHVTRVLGQNPGVMTLQGTNSYILQPPSNTNAPLILIDTSSPHTDQQYVDLLFTHLHHLGLQSGIRETHFESAATQQSINKLPDDPELIEKYKADLVAQRKVERQAQEPNMAEYGSYPYWSETMTKERKLPTVEHIILTHRHLDHVGALPLLLTTLKKHGCPPPKLWKLPSPDEAVLQASERDRPTTDAALWTSLPEGTYTGLNPFQPFHPIMPGLMISIIDPAYRHLLKYDQDGKPRWNEVPEVARVSVRCLKTPGHTADSISLVLCEGEKGVFTGDTVLGQGTTIFTDLSAYMTSLRTLLSLKPNVIYPAHGPHITTPEACTALLEEYIHHRQTREDQILSVLTDLHSNPGSLGEKIKQVLNGIEKRKDRIGPPRNGGLGWQKVGSGENEVIKGTGVPVGKWSRDGNSFTSETLRGSDDEDEDGEGGDGDGEGSEAAVDFGFQEPAPSQRGGRKKVSQKKPKKNKSDQDQAVVDSEHPDARSLYDSFPKSSDPYCQAITIPQLCYLLYKTDDERVIAAAGKSVRAHLEKLEREGKVSKGSVTLPTVVEGVVGQLEAGEGWELIVRDVKDDEVNVEAEEKMKTD